MLPEQAADLNARCIAALESSAEHTVIASVTAARLHCMWLPDLPDRIHVATASPGRLGQEMTRTRRPEFVAHRFQLGPDDVVLVNGVTVTSPARTWRDLARVLALPDLVAAGDSAIRAGATLDELAAQLTPLGSTAQLAKARTALSLLDRRSRSRPESHLRVAVTAPDLPRFEVNTAVYRDEGGWLAEPDLSLAAAKIALEYQGVEHAEIVRMRKDLVRFADLRSEKWLVLPYGPTQVLSRPYEIRAEVRAELRQRAPRLLGPVRRGR